MKTCIKCNQSKPIDLFATSLNRKKERVYLNSCKECMREYKKSHYNANKQAYLDKAKKQREKNPEEYKKYLNEYYLQNKEDLKAKAKEYVKTEQGKEVRRKCNRNYFSKDINRFKHNARKKVLRALQKGTLIKPSECEVCGLELPLQAHHHDYSKPLDVRWVCIQCHENIHHLNEGNTSLE